jgi:hypothetical protein
MNTRARARKLVQEGIAALKANDTATAATRFQQATELTPDDPVGWVWRASITTDMQEKQQYLKWAVMIAPESDAGKRAQSELKRIEQEEQERQERERLERERQEQERLAREQQQRERQEREQAEQAQAAAAQSRGKWRIPTAQTLNKFLSSAKDMVNEQKMPQVPKPTMPQVPKLKMPEPPEIKPPDTDFRQKPKWSLFGCVVVVILFMFADKKVRKVAEFVIFVIYVIFLFFIMSVIVR